MRCFTGFLKPVAGLRCRHTPVSYTHLTLDDVYGEGALSDIQENGGIPMELCIDRLTKQYENKIAVDRVSLQPVSYTHLPRGERGLKLTITTRIM